MLISAWLTAVRNRLPYQDRSTKRRADSRKRSSVLEENLEIRALLAAPTLVAVRPNIGAFLEDGDVRNIAPKELTLQFNPGQRIDSSNNRLFVNSPIVVERSGQDGIFGNGNDVPITLGYVGLGASAEDVVLRFGENLSDDYYRITIKGTGPNPLQNVAGEDHANGTDGHFAFRLDLGAQVKAVVPMPITRGAGGALTQARNQIVVYFNSDVLLEGAGAGSAERPEFYRLMNTRNTVENTDDATAVHFPMTVDYSAVTKSALLTFASDIDALSGAGTYRLRIGTDETVPLAPTVTSFAETFISDFGSTGAATVTIEPIVSVDGNPITLNFTKAALATNGVPAISVSGRTINIQLDTSGGTTPGQLYWSLNLHPQASDLVRTTIAGNQNFNIATTATAFPFSFIYSDPGSSFNNNSNLGILTSQSRVVKGQIRSLDYPFDFPGNSDEPGHREIDVSLETHLELPPDSDPQITTLYYNFQKNYGFSPQGVALSNLITENQKQRVREAFELYARSLGVQFVESDNLGFTMVTGDLRAIDPNILTGAGGVTGQSSRALNLAIMDNAEVWNDTFAGSYFTTAMHEIGHLLGMGHAYDLPDLTAMGGFEGPIVQTTAAEPDFPGDADIVHGQVLFRPESRDIDLYRFELASAGAFSAETVAERLSDSSLLDSTLRLFRQNADGTRNLISQNDDYFSEDSLLSLNLEAGIYFIGISASGNDAYDPRIADNGMYGTTQGRYELRLTFRPGATSAIVDITGQRLDGDHDGVAGGEFNFWFRAVPASSQLVVDKLALPGGNGSLATPYKEIDLAFAAAQPGQVVRLVGNGGADLDVATRADNVAYQIGLDDDGLPLVDGGSMDIPRNVVVMIDAGSLLKFQDSYIGVGSSSLTVDRSGASLQVLGTPFSEVVFTSWRDQNIGQDTTPTPTTPNQGNWGGLVFRHDVDNDENRLNYERLGIFMDYVAHANMSYGGGKLEVDSVQQIINPITLIEARPGIYNNFITLSEDSAISADPDSFEETTLSSPAFQAVGFTPDYSRIGPDIFGNTLLNNSTNGLFVRIQTAPGSPTKQMTVSGRFNDSDIVHVVAENLKIQGTPGGPFLEVNVPPVVLVTVTPQAGGTLSTGTYNYKVVFTDGSGGQSPPSAATRLATLTAGNGTVALANLPPASTPYNGRLLYRSQDGGAGPYDLIGVLNSTSTTFVDNGTTLTGILNETLVGRNRARLDASLVIDPDIIVKLESSRIEVGMSAQLIAEGAAGRNIIFTSRLDDRYGAGGTFDTNNDDLLSTEASPSRQNNIGLWGGIYFAPTSTGSFDQALMTFAGGVIPTDGDFAGFNAIEAHQSKLRVANTVFEENRDGTGGSAPASRFGRTANASGTIFARGAQPVILNNIFRDNSGPVLTINVNALTTAYVDDYGRSTGLLDKFSGFEFNQGPLVSDNLLGRNAINGMVIRGEVLTTQSVWDDTDIVHVVLNEIMIPNFHTYGGVRLNSDPDASLVVKLQGAFAGFTAGGKPLDIDDRIGGTLQIVGQPFFPVVLTSLSDDSLGSGFGLDGLPLKDTNSNGPSTGAPGNWRSVRITQYANDRNVEIYNENETTSAPAPGTNSTASKAEFLGGLGQQNLRTTNPDGTHRIQNTTDENLRLGFEVQGYINSPGDVDVYSFSGTAGSEVWIDIDRTNHALDTVVELITASGSIIALSDNSHDEQIGLYSVYKSNLLTKVNPLDKSQYLSDDLYGTNQKDAGFRIILPGVFGTTGTYQVRVRSSNIDSLNPAANRADLTDPAKVFNGITQGSYQLQIRLQETDEIPGSTVRFANIRFATNGVELFGMPAHSPLAGEYGESTTGANNTAGGAENVGNILNTDRAAVAVAGRISAPNDVDFYRFDVDFDDIQQIPGQTNPNRYASVIFDVDYADGMSRGNLQAHVFDAETNRLILTARDSSIADDRSGPLEGGDIDDLTRGSAGALDAYIGPFELPEGSYYLVVTSHNQIPQVLEQTMVAFPVSDTIRLEPITAVRRIADEHFGGFGTATAPLFDLYDNERGQNLTAFHLGDVNLFVTTYVNFNTSPVFTVDGYTGTVETQLGTIGRGIGDAAMRPDGELFAYGWDDGAPVNDANRSHYFQVDTGTAAITDLGDEGILTFHFDANGNAVASDVGIRVTAMTFFDATAGGGLFVGQRGDGTRGGVYDRNILYQYNARTGDAISQGALRTGNARANPPAGTDVVEVGSMGGTALVTGLASIPAGFFAVDTNGVLFDIFGAGPVAQILDPNGDPVEFQGLVGGPDEVEGGAYANILFGIDDDGVIYAFDTNGVLQPFFVDGQTSIPTGLGGAVGISFGTLDRSLWSSTGRRATDVGHGILASPDGTRLDTPGGSSLYFGNQRGGADAGNKNDLGSLGTLNNVNFPGGATGSFITNPFSLEGYAAGDKPTLYFNYFLDTSSLDYIPGVRPMMDSLRAYVGDGTTWSLVATNDSYREVGVINDERDFGPFGGATQHPTTQLFPDVVELYDEQTPPRWRQARVDLSHFAGRSDLKVRFEYAASGSVNVGDITTVGEEFYARQASTLRDGQSYILEGVNQFEIEMGFTLVAPSVSVIGEGETFTIQGRVFEFDKNADGVTGGRVPVTINSAMSPAEIAIAMERAIDGAAIANLVTYRDSNRIGLILEPPLLPISTAITLSQSVGAGLIVDGAPGVTPGTTSIVIHAGMSREDVAEVMAQRLADHLLPSGVYREEELNNSRLLAQDLEALSWTSAANNTITASATLPHISVIGTSTVGTGTDFYAFTVTGPGSRRVVVDLDGTVASFNSMIRIVNSTGGMLFENINGGSLDIGSNHSAASFLDVTLAPGDYFIQVGVPPVLGGAAPAQRYTLHLSVAGHAVNANGVTAPLVVDRFNIKSHADMVRIIGHYVTNAGPMGLTTYLPGDEFGGFYAGAPAFAGSLRGMSNAFEGVYIDDIVIGLAERGEMVTGAPANTTFIPNWEVNDPFNLNPYLDILEGDYDIEVRRATDYAQGSGLPNPQVLSIDSNDRMTEQQTLIVANAWDLTDGRTFTLSDGVDSVVFEYDDISLGNGVAPGHFAIPYDPRAIDSAGHHTGERAHVIAARIRDAINSTAVQGILDVIASLADGTADNAVSSTSNKVNIYGNALFSLGDGLQSPDRDASPVGVNSSMAALGNTAGSNSVFSFTNTTPLLDPSTGYPERINSIRIQLPAGQTFDPIFLMGGTGNGPSINAASDFDTPTFTSLDALNPRVPVFTFSSGFDLLTINFSLLRGPGFDENDQLIFGLDIDFGPEPIHNLGSIVQVTFSSGRIVHAEYVTTSETGKIGVLRPLADPTSVQFHKFYGDQNQKRDQGQLLIHSNIISDSAQWGVIADAGARSGAPNPNGAGVLPHAGPVRNLREPNLNRWLPGAIISNNVITQGGSGGILFSGDPTAGALAPVAIGRLINNTIVGNPASPSGVGIQVEQNASPTMLNNILADLATGVSVDASSQALGTVLGGTLYRGNGTNANTGAIGLGTFPIQLAAGDPLFVDQANRNYYPAPLSKAIDSSLDGLGDRTTFITVKDPLGIGVSPVKTPDLDVFGQVRGDDPDVSTPASQGANVFKDRGAIDRVDFFRPTAKITGPLDQDPNDLNPALNSVWLNLPGVLRELVVTLSDAGIGVDDNGVLLNGSQFRLFMDDGISQPTDTTGTEGPLVNGTDYVFVYNSTTNEVIFRAVTTFPFERKYRIIVDNDNSNVDNDGVIGIRDLAGNFLAPNLPDGTTQFNLLVTDGINDPPVNTVPGPGVQSTLEDTTLVFSAANGNAISVADADVWLGTNRLKITLTATNGNLSLKSGFNPLLFTFTGGSDGIDDVVIIFEGIISDLNAALDGLQFKPNADYFGPASVTVLSDDLGNFSGPPLPPPAAETDTDVILINVISVNDKPIFNLQGNPAPIDEDSGLVTIPAFMTGQAAGPTNETPPQGITVAVTVTSETGNWTPATFFSTAPSIDPVTGTLTFRTAQDVNGTATISVTVTDTNASPVESLTKTFVITVNAVNDIPVFAVTGTDARVDGSGNITTLEDAGGQTIIYPASFAAGRATALDEVGAQLPLVWSVSTPTLVSGNLNFTSLTVNPVTGVLSYNTTQDTAGSATIVLTLTDAGSNVAPNVNFATRTVTINVTQVNDAPVARTGNYVVDEGDSIMLDASMSFDVDAPFGDFLTKYEWDLDNDGFFETDAGSSATLTRTWAELSVLGITAPSVRTIRLRVTDNNSPVKTTGTTTATLTTLIVDYGDAADTYGTLRPGGAAHTIANGLFLGTGVTKEQNGQPSATADLDSDDGVVFPTFLETSPTIPLPAFVDVTVSAAGKLDIWLDKVGAGFGVFDASEKLNGVSYDVNAGLNRINFTIPAGTTIGDSVMRFRLSTAGSLPATGRANNGEVEDYAVKIRALQNAVTPTINGPATPTTDLAPTVTWTQHPENFNYDLVVRNSLNVVVFTRLTTSFTYAQIAPPLPAGIYTSTVTAYNKAGESALAGPATRQFEIIPPIITAPTGSVTSPRPQIVWDAVNGAATYRVELFNLTDNVLVSTVNGITTTNWTPTADLVLAEYRITLTAFNALGQTSTPGVRNFTVAPQAPVATLPTGRLSDSTPTFNWSAVAGANRYELVVSQKWGTFDVVINQSNLTTTTFTQPTPLGLGRYTYRIRAINDPSNASVTLPVFSSYAAVYEFVNVEPPVLTGPTLTTFSNFPTVTWVAPPNSEKFDVYYRMDMDPNPEFLRVNGVTGTSYTPTKVFGIGTYVVWVRTYSNTDNPATVADEREASDWSIGRTFRVSTPPTVVGPIGRTAVANPTLSWQSVPGALNYEIHINNDSVPVAKLYNQTGIASLSYTVPANLPIGNYTFWVRARNGFGFNSNWSAPQKFEVVTAPVLTGPPASTFNLRPTFAWTNMMTTLGGLPAGAASYEFRLQAPDPVTFKYVDLPDFTVANLTTNTHTIPIDLPTNTSYRAYVIALGNGRPDATPPVPATRSNWSLGLEFFVGGRPIVNTIPPTTNTSPTLTWGAVAGASGYEVFIATGAQPGTNLLNASNNKTGSTSFIVPLTLSKGVYRYWVRAFNASTGAASLWSLEKTLTIVKATIPAQEQSLPVATEFVWTVVPGLVPQALVTESAISMVPAVIDGSQYVPLPEEVVNPDSEIPVDASDNSANPVPSVEDVAVTDQTDSVLSKWDEQVWWESQPVAEQTAAVEQKNSAAGFLGALFALAPRSLRRRKE